MADDAEEFKQEKPFHVDRAKTGRAGCKKCKEKIAQGELRMGKLGYNPFSSGTMIYWHHVKCMFEVFSKQRKTTKRIDSYSEIEGWDKISEDDKNVIQGHFSAEELAKFDAAAKEESAGLPLNTNSSVAESKDNSFRAFRKICSELTNASSYLTKTSIVKEFFENGSDGKSFTGDIQLWCKSLLPMAAKRVYNLQSKQLVKIFSDIFKTDQDVMLEDLEQGDVAETIGNFFDKSLNVSPAKKAVLSLHDVEEFLEYLSKLTREADQTDHFRSILTKCTTNDLKIIIRMIKHDLRINAGPKHILEALDPNAYPAFQASRDLKTVVANAVNAKKGGQAGTSKGAGTMKVGVSIMTPVLPMLAEACPSVDKAFKKCPDGMFSEIKYDGERVQLHKQGDIFKYFSRSLKPVLDHKVRHFERYIPQAFPHGRDIILDSEILMVDTKTNQPLPFGTLGVHKKAEFKDACVCLFVFDCIYYNGESLIDRPIKERRKILMENIKEVKHRVVVSEMEEIHEREDLEAMMVRVFREGLEGLVLKPLNSKYEPGKRHWLKVKKDYLAGGTMADSADLVVLGAWFGTGKKGGIMSVFLMGCWDEKRRRWVTVTKVHGGHDDRTLELLQTQLRMEKISRDAGKVPAWLHCAKTMVPDFVAKDPKDSQVWEIQGAEFTCNQVHTADGISIRFPRVTRIRRDKDWMTATSLAELKKLYATSKDTSNFTLSKDSAAAQSSESENNIKGSPNKIDTANSDSDTSCDDKSSLGNAKYKNRDCTPIKDKRSKDRHEEGGENKRDHSPDSTERNKKQRKSEEGDENSSDTKKRSKDHTPKREETSSKDSQTPEKFQKSNENRKRHRERTPSSPRPKQDDATTGSSKREKYPKSHSSDKCSKNQENSPSNTNDRPEKTRDHRSKRSRERTPNSSSQEIKDLTPNSSEKRKSHERSPGEKASARNRSEEKDAKRRSSKDRTDRASSSKMDSSEKEKRHSRDESKTPKSKESNSSHSSKDREQEKRSRHSKSSEKEKRHRTSNEKRRSRDKSKTPIGKESNGSHPYKNREEEKRSEHSDSSEKEKILRSNDDSREQSKTPKSKENNISHTSRDPEQEKTSRHSDSSEKGKRHTTNDDKERERERKNRDEHRRRERSKSKETRDRSSHKHQSVNTEQRKIARTARRRISSEDEPPTANVAITMKNLLPDVFTNHVLMFHPKVPDANLLKRFVIAYGGTIYNEAKNTCLENGKGPITHVIYPGKKIDKEVVDGDGTIKHVTVDWVWDSVKQKKVAPEREFRVEVWHSRC